MEIHLKIGFKINDFLSFWIFLIKKERALNYYHFNIGIWSFFITSFRYFTLPSVEFVEFPSLLLVLRINYTHMYAQHNTLLCLAVLISKKKLLLPSNYRYIGSYISNCLTFYSATFFSVPYNHTPYNMSICRQYSARTAFK